MKWYQILVCVGVGIALFSALSILWGTTGDLGPQWTDVAKQYLPFAYLEIGTSALALFLVFRPLGV